ncbi:MAG: RhuM family protein [Gammaproteobacteria bacterium]|nr:RhuM family protein [Gammaproteobacteria bacterium]
MSTKLIRNSTAEFLIFTGQAGEQSIEARFEDNSIWLTQKLMAELFQVQPQNITQHLKNIYAEGEVQKAATCKDFLQVQTEGDRQVKRQQKHYNLDAIISVGYRVNSLRATQFRQWATRVLREFAIKGYVIDRERMENGSFLDEDYFERLLEEIREIRLSERRFYQKIADIYATSLDYNKDAPTTKAFFATVQNKLHFAMNYLSKDELGSLGRIVNAYLELAEDRATRKIPMTMEDWAKRLDAFLQFDERDILQDNGNISASIAKKHAESEFEKYRIVQDRLYTSDFDKLVKTAETT